MNPISYIKLARDVAIFLALGFIVWMIYGAGKNSVKVSDLKQLQSQISAQAAILEGWRKDSDHANAQLSSDMAQIDAIVGAPKPPVRLCRSAGSKPPVLPSTASEAGSEPSGGGGADTGPGIDLRPRVDAFERKYETALAECRAALAQWPK